MRDVATRSVSIPGRHEDRRLERLLVDHYSAVVDRAERLNDGDPDAAEELAQEVFTQAGELLRRNHVASAWDAQEWLETTTLRLDHARNVERTGIVAAAEMDEALADVAGARVDHALVRRALHDLDRREAVALRLHYVEGLRHSQIARHLRIPATEVARLLREGRAHLRDWYVALAEAAGRLVVVQWVVQRARRVREVLQRADERLVAALRLDALPALGGWAATATNLTLATLVAVAVAAAPERPAHQPSTTIMDRADGAPHPTSATPPPPATAGEASPTSGVVRTPATVKVSPGVVAQPQADKTQFFVSPVEGDVEEKYTVEFLPGAPGLVSAPIGFECPPPDRRPPGPAVGCPILEAVS